MPVRPSVRWRVLERDGYRCKYCGRYASEPGVTLEVDHILPVVAGGSHDLVNLITACRDCNAGKWDRLPGGERASREPDYGHHRLRRPPTVDERPVEIGAQCWMPLAIACFAYYLGDTYQRQLEAIEARGFPTPPGPRSGRKWMAIVRADPSIVGWIATSLASEAA